MNPETRLQNALRSAEPGRALRALVQGFSGKGHSESEIYELLEKSVLQLRTRAYHPVSDEEMILGVMDALTGWRHPEARLLNEG